MSEFERLQEMVSKCQATSSSNDKKKIVSEYPDLQKLLRYTFDSFKQYYVTSDNIKKQWTAAIMADGPNLLVRPKDQRSSHYGDIYQLLDDLDNRTISGYDAVAKICRFINRKENVAYKDLIMNIFDRDLKCRVSSTIINKVWPGLIPEFNTALAMSFWDNESYVDFAKDTWYASRKLDGVRLLTVIDEEGKVKCMSRNGKEFLSLGRLKEEIQELWPTLKNAVLDGEICIVDEDGDEHFDQIIKLVTRKDYTIPFPKYRVFDILKLEEFGSGTSELTLSQRQARWQNMKKVATRETDMIVPLDQWKIKDRAHLDELFAMATEKNWEGLIIRKDAPYQGKRSQDMLKVKAFNDAEYEVKRCIMGPFQVVVDGKEVQEDMLASVKIEHKGNEVGVGSGFNLEQRRYYFQHPDQLVGKTITVKYFEETVDSQTGKPSLRFPIVKHIYDEGRDA